MRKTQSNLWECIGFERQRLRADCSTGISGNKLQAARGFPAACMEVRMKRKICMVALILVSALCGCGAGQGCYRTEEGSYFCDGEFYQNVGEILLSERELEYGSLIQSFPEGIQGAEWYTELYQYGEWLLLGLDDSRSLSGLEGYRYFLLVPAADAGEVTGEYQVPAGDGTLPAIYCNGALYQNEGEEPTGDMLNHMEAVGIIQGVAQREPGIDFHANYASALGHLVFEHDGKLLISVDGGQGYGVFSMK